MFRLFLLAFVLNAVNSLASEISLLKPVSKRQEAPVVGCADLSGDWKGGECVILGKKHRGAAISLKQNGCEDLIYDGMSYAIGALTQTTVTKNGKTDSSQVTLEWNESKTILALRQGFLSQGQNGSTVDFAADRAELKVEGGKLIVALLLPQGPKLGECVLEK